MSSGPPLSVIVITHNGGAGLPAALASVWEQRGVQPEIIVVDRGSDDATRAWLEANRSRFAALEFDGGNCHLAAANLGLATAQGEWVLFLQGRDRLVGDMVLSECLDWMRATEAGVVAGESAADDGTIHKLHSRVNALARDFVPPSAAFYRRTLFEENGAFDPTLGAMAAYEFHVRLWKSRVRFKPVPIRVTACEAAEPFDRAACIGEIRTRHRYFAAWRCWPWDAMSLLRWLKPRGLRRGD